ncbi:S-layer homology domain-containing protein [Geomicrobium sp. JSM 1781026]|uniref:S-layer homology domain-containing protein n=1 Tax=Geomicrobium sp. JSM 1781026 TaxID=3344580 RepID=UPI0035BF2FB1
MAYQPKSYRKFIAGTMTAAMAASAFAVTTPQQVADAQEQRFSDVAPTHHAYETIQRAADRGIVNGYSDGTYRPSEQLIRGQAARMIANAIDLDTPPVTSTPFEDLSAESVYADVAVAMHAEGIIIGRHGGTQFDAGTVISREQMASILVRAFDLEPIPGADTNFTDLDDAYEAHLENIEILAHHGITSVESGLFRPKQAVDRTQMAVFLDRAMDVRNTLDAGIVSAQALNSQTVDVTFAEEVTAADAEQFAFPGLEVLDANVVADEDGNNTIVRLTTSTQTADEEYRLYYNGDRTSITFTGSGAEATTPVDVTEVTAITPYGIYVEFDAPGEELVDATVVVQDPNGTTHEVYPQDLAADDTEALFEFVEAPVFPEAGTWIVNGVNYTMEFGIGVEALDRIGETVELTFNATVEELSVNDIVVRDAITNERRGIASVVLAEDGRSAQVSFLPSSDQGGGAFLEPLREYNFQMTIPGFPPATYTFERPAYLENVRVVDSSASDETVTFNDGTTLNAYEGTDFEAVLGTGGTVAFNSSYDIVDFFIADEEVLLGAVTDVRFVGTGDNRRPVEIALNGEWYDLADGYDLRYNGEVGTSLASVGGPTADYAKFVLNSQGEVAFYDAYDWDASILVEEVNDGIVSGFGQELDVNDYTIVEDGQTISYGDLTRGDNLFFNDDAEYAEVYNDVVVGNIDRIFQNSVVIDGEEYDFDTESAYYIDENGEVRPLNALVFEDFENSDEPVSLYLNRAGEISFVLGDLGSLVRSEDGAYLTADANAFTQGARSIVELNYVNTAGEEDDVTLTNQSITTLNGYTPGQVVSSDDNRIVDDFEFTFDDDGTGSIQISAEGALISTVTFDENNNVEGQVIDLVRNSDGEVVGLNTLEPASSFNVGRDLDSASVGQNFLNLGTEENPANVRVFSATPVFLQDGAGNIEGVYSWGEIEEFDLVHEATVYHSNNTDGVVDYLVVDIDNTDIESAVTEYNVVVDSVTLNAAGTEVARLTAIVNGERQTFDVDLDDDNEGNDIDLVNAENAEDETVRGLLAEIGVNEDGVVTELGGVDSNSVVAGELTVESLTNRTVSFEVDGVQTTFTIEADGYLVSNTGDTLTINTSNLNWLSDIGEDNSVRAVLAEDNSRFIDYIVIDDAGEDAEDPIEEDPDVDEFETIEEGVLAVRSAVTQDQTTAFRSAIRGLFDIAETDIELFEGLMSAYQSELAADDDALATFPGIRDVVSLVNGSNTVNASFDEVDLDLTVSAPSGADGDFELAVADVTVTVADDNDNEVTIDADGEVEDGEYTLSLAELTNGEYSATVDIAGFPGTEVEDIEIPNHVDNVTTSYNAPDDSMNPQGGIGVNIAFGSNISSILEDVDALSVTLLRNDTELATNVLNNNYDTEGTTSIDSPFNFGRSEVDSQFAWDRGLYPLAEEEPTEVDVPTQVRVDYEINGVSYSVTRDVDEVDIPSDDSENGEES